MVLLVLLRVLLVLVLLILLALRVLLVLLAMLRLQLLVMLRRRSCELHLKPRPPSFVSDPQGQGCVGAFCEGVECEIRGRWKKPEAMVADARWPPIPVRPSIIRGAGSRQAENRRRSEERLRA